MSDSSTLNLKSIFLEAFFVVMGVVLALAANGLRETYLNERRASSALTSILEELAGNQQAVDAAIGYHSQLLDTLNRFARAYGDDPNRYPSGALFSKGFINPAKPLSRAWDAAATTGVIEYMPYEDVLLLAQVYETQRIYQTQGISVGEQIYGRIFDQGTLGVIRNYRNLQIMIGTFVYRECELARAYVDILPRLQADPSTVSVHDFCQYLPGS